VDGALIVKGQAGAVSPANVGFFDSVMNQIKSFLANPSQLIWALLLLIFLLILLFYFLRTIPKK